MASYILQCPFYVILAKNEAPLDYTSFATSLTFRVGADGSRASHAECTSVVLLDDVLPEETECFTFNIESLDPDLIEVDEERAQKRLCILDDDGIEVSIEQTSYVVEESTGSIFQGLLICATVEDVQFSFNLSALAQPGTAEQQVDYTISNAPISFIETSGNQTQCTYVQVIDDDMAEGDESFNITFSSDNPFVVVLTPTVSVTIADNDDSVVFPGLLLSQSTQLISAVSNTGVTSIKRSISIEHARNCSAHLINDGVTVVGDSVTVEWQGTGPSQTNRNTQFNCLLDSEPRQSCSSVSGFSQTNLASGNHLLIIRPVKSGGCRRLIDLQVHFNIN